MSSIKVSLLWLLLTPGLLLAQRNSVAKNKEGYVAYLFVYFTGNDKKDEQIRFALSNDGYHYRALNGNQPVVHSAGISETGGVRDPHILRGADGKSFYMVATDMVSANGWNSNRAMVLMTSSDLTHWKGSIVNIQKKYPNQEALQRVWAPQTIYDSKAGKYMVYFSMKHGNDPDKIYYAYANKEFTDLETEPKQLFFSPTNGACIDGDIISKDGKYYLFFKTEGEGAGIKTAVSDTLTGGYVLRDKYVQQTTDPVEGAGTFSLNDGSGYVLMYDLYTKGRYQFTKTQDLSNFTVIDQEVTMNFHPRHGTVIPITANESQNLMARWGSADDVITSSRSVEVKKLNVALDTMGGVVVLPVKPGTNVKSFDPQFTLFPGASITPATPQNFLAGPINYTVSIKGKTPRRYQLMAKAYSNPVLEGYYADPEILYAVKTGLFYLYPTSDGFNNWSGTYFKTFSSADLVNWKDEGVILDLQKDVTWAKKNAWAPCIIEKKINGAYKYFYYFCAAQKIGVAVSDNPTGPFTDLGKPLVDQFPPGVSSGQQIDPDVFTDPVSGKSYLFWGNGYMAGAELNDDMVSVTPGTIKLLTPDKTFREGVYVFYRKGTYYFMWSENDTRDKDYGVRYGTASSPLGSIAVPPNNQVITKNKAVGIYGTGHNAVLQVPGTDDWYLVYHRFNFPNGIHWGEAAGFNREVCIDKLAFNDDGSILQVMPTHEGIPAIKLK